MIKRKKVKALGQIYMPKEKEAKNQLKKEVKPIKKQLRQLGQ